MTNFFHYFKQLGFYLSVGLFLVSCPPVYSAEKNSENKSFDVRPWAVGQSITLQTKNFLNGNLQDSQTITYSVVDEEEVEGKKYFWLEIEKTKSIGATSIVKLEVRKLSRIDFENVINGYSGMGTLPFLKAKRKIQQINLKFANRTSAINEFELPAETVDAATSDTEPSAGKDLSSHYLVSNRHEISVSAGVFKSFEFDSVVTATKNTSISETGKSKRIVWGSPEVPILGLVKIQNEWTDSNKARHRNETELVVAKEDGGTSKIKNKPQFISLMQQRERKQGNSKKSQVLNSSQGQP
ncbi:MAG TPA: hypothetical protein VK791_10015 [bacterium]|jgi:hypothetical protein|nr:hypothetical protein [bacterium]